MSWRKFPIPLTELCIDTTLRCGQSFRWKQSPPGTYSCALQGRILSLRQDATHLHYRAIYPSSSLSAPATASPPTPRSDGDPPEDVKPTIKIEANPPTPAADADDDTEAFLRHYLNLTPDLGALYAHWAARDANFAARAPRFAGVRVLRQDAWEALVGFVCSSNNNIARIAQMVDKLCTHYGPRIGFLEDGTAFYDLPPPSALAGSGVEEKLRDLGFGYRAKYIAQTAARLAEEEPGWLDALRNPEKPAYGAPTGRGDGWRINGRMGYHDARAALQELSGVGPKVADCVCLMGLGWGEAVPVDTHVWRIAVRDYGFGHWRGKAMSGAIYDAVGMHFRELWGEEAGWAHSVLFTADLRAFEERAAGVVKDEEDVVVNAEEGEVKIEVKVKEEGGVVVKEERAGVGNDKSARTPVKKIKVEVKEEPSLSPSGRMDGLSMYANGVKKEDVKQESIEFSPAADTDPSRQFKQRSRAIKVKEEDGAEVKQESSPFSASRQESPAPVAKDTSIKKAMAVRDHNEVVRRKSRGAPPSKLKAEPSAPSSLIATPVKVKTKKRPSEEPPAWLAGERRRSSRRRVG